MQYLFFVVAFLGSIAGAVVLATQFSQGGAQDSTMIAALAVALAVIPYCLARSWQELWRTHREANLPEEVGKAVAEAPRVAKESRAKEGTVLAPESKPRRTPLI